MSRLQVGDVDVDERVLVIAEIGNNHEGDLGRARELVEQAAETGVDGVKLQTFRTELYVSPLDSARFDQLKGFELGDKGVEELASLAHGLGLAFLSTPFDLDSAAFLEPLVDAFKIASGDNDFYPLIERVARTRRPLLVSTGVSDAAQVERTVAAVEEVRGAGEQAQLAILHCVSAYPAPAEALNLRSIPFLASRFPYPVGWSDHALGTTAAPAAVAAGARIVEKHFTLEGIESDFRDHALSATPSQMRELVQRVRETEQMLGRAQKEVQPEEEPVAAAVRRSIAAARDLRQGSVLEAGDLVWLRPSGGLRPGQEELLVGRRLTRDVARGEQLRAEDVDA
jgi:N,N'-diacetyllegionaminate synthase